MTTEEKVRLIYKSEVRAIRALRNAMTLIQESWEDVNVIAAIEIDDTDPAQQTRNQVWGEFRPLLLAARNALESTFHIPVLGEQDARVVVGRCNAALKAIRRRERERFMQESGLNDIVAARQRIAELRGQEKAES